MFGSEKDTKGLDPSTFDIVKVESFHNTRFWTLVSCLWVWILLLLKLAILGGDTYTCISILVFNRWSSSDYKVYEYKVAKWIFAGCILFRFLLLAYQIAWAIHVYRTRNIALAYLNNYARMMYAIRSYDYQCLFHEIESEGFFEWASFYVYTELDNALEVLVADLPRQVINFMTLRYYATGGDLNNDILENIKTIATTNLTLSVILSFQLCTVALFLFFFFKFLFAIILFIPIKVKVAHRGFKSLKSFCYRLVNEKVRILVKFNHKSKTQILNEGILDIKEIQANSLLSSSSTLDLSGTEFSNPFDSESNIGTYGRFGSNVYSSSNISLSDLTAGNPEGYSRVLPSQTNTLSSVEENPFADSSRDKEAARENFMNNVADDAHSEKPWVAYPASSIQPPVRSQTSETLMTRHAQENAMIFGKNIDDSTGSHVDVSTNSNLALSHTDYDEQDISLNDNSSRGNLINRKLPEGDDWSDESSESQHSENKHNVNYTRELRDPFSDRLSSEDDQTPYPVRGVSQYYDPKVDE